jgi:hypothetical protein
MASRCRYWNARPANLAPANFAFLDRGAVVTLDLDGAIQTRGDHRNGHVIERTARLWRHDSLEVRDRPAPSLYVATASPSPFSSAPLVHRTSLIVGLGRVGCYPHSAREATSTEPWTEIVVASAPELRSLSYGAEWGYRRPTVRWSNCDSRLIGSGFRPEALSEGEGTTMIWALLALLGVPLWLCAAGLSILLVRNRALRHRPGNVKVRRRRPGKSRWRRGYGVWVHDVFAASGCTMSSRTVAALRHGHSRSLACARSSRSFPPRRTVRSSVDWACLRRSRG